MRLLAVACLLMTAQGLGQTQPADPGIARRIQADVEFLASDRLEGAPIDLLDELVRRPWT